MKSLKYLIAFCLLFGNLLSAGQKFEKDILIQRFNFYKELDSLNQIKNKSAHDLAREEMLENKIVLLDNQLLRDYLNTNSIEGRKSKLRVLMDENNRLNQLSEHQKTYLQVAYVVGSLLLIGLITFLILYFQSLASKRAVVDKFNKLHHSLDSHEYKKHEMEADENELIESLQAELFNYKDELTKATDFIVSLRNEKIAAENALADTQEKMAVQEKNIKKYQKENEHLKQSENENYEKIMKQKTDAEERYNLLFEQFSKMEKEWQNWQDIRSKLQEGIEKEKQARETIRQEFQQWVEVKNKEVETLQKKLNRSERELQDLKRNLSALLQEQVHQDKALSQKFSADFDNKENILAGIKKVLKSKDDMLALSEKEKKRLKTEREDLNFKIEHNEYMVDKLHKELENHKVITQREIEKRKKLESQLHNMLNNLKGGEE
jgi:hypothetical protein